MTTGNYVLGYSAAERERLVGMAAMRREEAVALLDRIGVQPGWHAIDLGCGPLGILDLLAERVGPAGRVVGVDQEPRTVAMARDFASEHCLGHVVVVEGDAGATGLPRASFDLVHARLLLVNVPDPERVLAEMVALARPGGIVAVQDLDGTTQSQYCEPPHPAYAALLDAFVALGHEQGQDFRIGRRLFALLRAAGLVDVEVAARVRVARAGEFGQSQLPTIIRSVAPRLIARGLLTEAALAAQLAALEAHLAAPGTITVDSPLFQVWGRKPR